MLCQPTIPVSYQPNVTVKLRAGLARRWLCQRRDKADPSASTVCYARGFSTKLAGHENPELILPRPDRSYDDLLRLDP